MIRLTIFKKDNWQPWPWGRLMLSNESLRPSSWSLLTYFGIPTFWNISSAASKLKAQHMPWGVNFKVTLHHFTIQSNPGLKLIIPLFRYLLWSSVTRPNFTWPKFKKRLFLSELFVAEQFFPKLFTEKNLSDRTIFYFISFLLNYDGLTFLVSGQN